MAGIPSINRLCVSRADTRVDAGGSRHIPPAWCGRGGCQPRSAGTARLVRNQGRAAYRPTIWENCFTCLGCLRVPTSVIALAAFAGAASAETVRGVSDTESVSETITDRRHRRAGRQQLGRDPHGIRRRQCEGRRARSQDQVHRRGQPGAVQTMNKLLNNDDVFMTLDNGGTPMTDANMQFAKNVPNVFPLTAARSMYEPC